MVTAFSALVNGGTLMKPYIVREIQYADGRREDGTRGNSQCYNTTRVKINFRDAGSGGRSWVWRTSQRCPGIMSAAKLAPPNSEYSGYTEETNHSFVGFAPSDDPKFVMLVKFEKPDRTYAEVTAAPVFADIAKFALQYYQVPPER